MVIFSPLYLAIIIYIYLLDGSETIIKQTGLDFMVDSLKCINSEL